jgi:hypothetical protein
MIPNDAYRSPSLTLHNHTSTVPCPIQAIDHAITAKQHGAASYYGQSFRDFIPTLRSKTASFQILTHAIFMKISPPY